MDYIAGLGSDAAPVVMRAVDQMKAPPSMLVRLPNALARSSGIWDDRNAAWPAWNLSREKARELLGR